MDKLQVAVFSTQPPHLYFGGVERRIMETGKRLSNEVNFTVYSGTKAGFREPVTIDGISIVPCSSSDRIFPLDNWTFNRTLSKMTTSIKADIYEAHHASGYGFQKALSRQGTKTPFIETIHGVLADEYARAQQHGGMSTRGRLANFFMNRLANLEGETARAATLIVTISKYSQQKIVEFYSVDPEKIRIVPNGVDPQRFKPDFEGCEKFRQRIGASGRRTVLFVGRLIPRKGLSYLIEAARIVAKEYMDVLFLIVGDGPLRSQLEAQVKEANLEGNFKFQGDVAETELPRFYNCADVFVLPSIQEGQGIVLLEAQASAVPVVAFNVTGVTEAVVNGETSLLTEPDAGRLAEGILKLLGDDLLRQKMGAGGREHILKELTWDVCAQRMLSVYREARQFP